MDDISTKNYIKILANLAVKENVTQHTITSLMNYVKPIYKADLDNRYSEPMLWIGLYIALASLCCVLAMVSDLIHGLRGRKLWFPCKYFSINATSLLVISVAMKLPVDLSGSMPGDVDQVAKLGSMAFMCTMMANLLPCLATMDNKELLTNITALGVQVITMVVNVCIQIETGVISYKEEAHLLKTVAKKYDLEKLDINKDRNVIIAIVYVTSLLVLLILYACSSLAILKSKEIIEPKYQHGHKTASEEVQQSKVGKFLTVKNLEQHVRNYWIMAGSGSPQFIIACCATTTAAGVICALTTILHTLTMFWSISAILKEDYDSDYKWSMAVILLVQFIGVILGTIAPLSRCFATVSFKVSTTSIWNYMKVHEVESYWTQKLCEWKQGSIQLPFPSHKLKVVILILKNQILKFCIDIQEGVVVVCKITTLIPFSVLHFPRYLKGLLQNKAMFSSQGKKSGHFAERQYVLQLVDKMELASRTLEGLSKSLKRLIQQSEKKHPKNLMNLITKNSTAGFQGVKKLYSYDHHANNSPSNGEYRDCWSMPVVTLTTIAVTLPNTEKVEVKSLLKSVREGLKYVKFVEESLNAADEYYLSFQNAAEMLWEEVDVHHKWLEIKLKNIAKVKDDAKEKDAAMQIVQWFLNEAKNKIKEKGGLSDDDSKFTTICANSMCLITQTIIDDKESNTKLFEELSSRIADIMFACLTNLPQVIAMKCHTEVIEKRVASVQAAAELLGETKQIINALQDPLQKKWNAYLSMHEDDLPFIDKWRAYLSNP